MDPAGGVGQSGQSTAELAVVLPVLVVLILAAVQVGLVATDYVAIHHAVRESARQAALDPTEATATKAAAAAGPDGLDPDRLTVTLDGGRSSGDLLTVGLQYRAPTSVPLVGVFIGDVTLNSTAVVRVE